MPADPEILYTAIGILGATVMPHNLYLHSSIVQSRAYQRSLKVAVAVTIPLSNTPFLLGGCCISRFPQLSVFHLAYGWKI